MIEWHYGVFKKPINGRKVIIMSYAPGILSGIKIRACLWEHYCHFYKGEYWAYMSEFGLPMKEENEMNY